RASRRAGEARPGSWAQPFRPFPPSPEGRPRTPPGGCSKLSYVSSIHRLESSCSRVPSTAALGSAAGGCLDPRCRLGIDPFGERELHLHVAGADLAVVGDVLLDAREDHPKTARHHHPLTPVPVTFS